MDKVIPSWAGVCPLCTGTTKVPLDEAERKYSWNRGKTHKDCRNCGGQTMFGTAAGYTKLDPETGMGCHHEYVGQQRGRSYVLYTCKKCRSSYDIDSGD